MEAKIEKARWWILRLYKPNEPDATRYVAKRDYHREWYATQDEATAAQFMSRSEARNRTRAVGIKYLWEHDGFFWEVIKITETRRISYEQEFVVSNAPPLYQLARAAQ